MNKNLYPVGFGLTSPSGNKLQTVEYFSSYEEARKAVFDYRNSPILGKYTVIQLGCDATAELMVYKPEIASWVITTFPCWVKEHFADMGKLCTLKIPVKTHKEQNMRMKLGWADAVVELFQTKFGIKFIGLEEWKNHYKQGTKKSEDHLEYSCMIPDASMRAITQSYACQIT